MKLYTPAEIATFVVSHDLGDADERHVIEALKQWDKKSPAHGDLYAVAEHTELAAIHPTDRQRGDTAERRRPTAYVGQT